MKKKNKTIKKIPYNLFEETINNLAEKEYKIKEYLNWQIQEIEEKLLDIEGDAYYIEEREDLSKEKILHNFYVLTKKINEIIEWINEYKTKTNKNK